MDPERVMADEPTEPETVSYWRIGRVYCPTCQIVANVVCQADVVLVCCPHCSSPAVASTGDEG